MDTFDPAGEFLRIAERYRRMSDEELQVLMPQSSNLTPFAQQALANEVRQRGLQSEVEVKNDKRSPSKASQFKPPQTFFGHEPPKFRDRADYDFSSPDKSSNESPSEEDAYEGDPYEEDRKLVDLCTVWSLRDALKVQRILDVAGIPFFMGKEKATGVDEVTSNFVNGVVVQIMQIGMPWARQPMQYYDPEDDPAPKEKADPGELTVRCPNCHSTEVVFEGRTPEPGKAADEVSHQYKWTCDTCGHQWEDDGLAKEE
jgi:DNA-directed RNA polymerase subunit M/transcription elongation factor TFIIS